MNILTTYFTASRLFTFVREGMMYVEFNSVALFSSIFAIYELRKRRVQGHCAAYHFRIVNMLVLFILNQPSKTAHLQTLYICKPFTSCHYKYPSCDTNLKTSVKAVSKCGR